MANKENVYILEIFVTQSLKKISKMVPVVPQWGTLGDKLSLLFITFHILKNAKLLIAKI